MRGLARLLLLWCLVLAVPVQALAAVSRLCCAMAEHGATVSDGGAFGRVAQGHGHAHLHDHPHGHPSHGHDREPLAGHHGAAAPADAAATAAEALHATTADAVMAADGAAADAAAAGAACSACAACCVMLAPPGVGVAAGLPAMGQTVQAAAPPPRASHTADGPERPPRAAGV